MLSFSDTNENGRPNTVSDCSAIKGDLNDRDTCPRFSSFYTIKGCKKKRTYTATKMPIAQSIFTLHTFYTHHLTAFQIIL